MYFSKRKFSSVAICLIISLLLSSCASGVTSDARSVNKKKQRRHYTWKKKYISRLEIRTYMGNFTLLPEKERSLWSSCLMESEAAILM